MPNYQPFPDPTPNWRRQPDASYTPAPPEAEAPAPPPLEEAPRTLEDPGVISRTEANDFRKLVAELSRRSIESLKLYEPLPAQANFHCSKASERLLRGSNRGGKTLPAAVEVARAVCGSDPFRKYPKTGGRCFAVGKDGKHLGQVMWRKLGRAGAFRVIRDETTNLWRAFRPWSAEDVEREDQSRPAPPMIPPRMIKSIAWENKKENQPNVVTLINGWEINFFSSLGKPPQGSDVDLVWLDEEIVDPDWYPEMSARLLDRNGRLIWSATPQAGTEHLYDLHQRCEEQHGYSDPDAQEFLILLNDNPHITERQKKEFEAKLATPEEVAVRVGGEFAVSSYKVYSEYHKSIHEIELAEIPSNWTRYMVVDPGHQVCAVLFAACPPLTIGRQVVLYDELYIRNCDAEKFGERVAARTKDQAFWAFLIDGHAGRQTQIGAGKTVESQYSDALKKRKVASARTGSSFYPGNDDVEAGIDAVRALLRVKEDGLPVLRVVKGRLPNFDFEIARYHYRRERGMVTDKPDQKRHNHIMDCLRYLAAYDPVYHSPKDIKKPLTGAIAAYRKKQEERRRKNGKPFVRLGPGVMA